MDFEGWIMMAMRAVLMSLIICVLMMMMNGTLMIGS